MEAIGDARDTFADRADAGRRLAEALAGEALERPVVYALPRGGVPVGLEIARALGAPLDLVLVRKIGAPGAEELALGAVVEGSPPQTVVNENVRRQFADVDRYLEEARGRALVEMERRRALYLGGRPRIDPAGRTAVLVDDGLATGATMKAALTAVRRQGAARIVVAVPVAPEETLAEIGEEADRVVCLAPSRRFRGVGAFYDDFHQMTDEETIGLLRQARATEGAVAVRTVSVPPLGLVGDLAVPAEPRGIVLFAHGSGSSRRSPRNRMVAETLGAKGFATLLLDLLTPDEARDRHNVFDIPLLAERLVEASLFIEAEPDVADLPLGLFGASTGAGAALVAAAGLGERVAAVVSRGGRPDLAGPRLAEVEAPTLLIVGGDDRQVLELNRKALAALGADKLLRIVPGAGHLFEAPGELETVTEMARAWFEHYLAPLAPSVPGPAPAETPAERDAARTVAVVRAAAEPLPDIEDEAFAAAFDRFGDARVVLLGEASHGTSEFYRARAAITRRLIERHGFAIVAVEADWPDAAAVDRDIRGLRPDILGDGDAMPFARFPTWMWRNREMEDFTAYLRARNAASRDGAVRFYGLDLYNLHASIAAVLAYLDDVDPETAAVARARYSCLAPWSREPAAYGRAAFTRGYASCEDAVARMLVDLLRKELDYALEDGDRFFDAAQNARLVAAAERYYRIMYYGAQETWNLRDRHMFATLANVLERHGPERDGRGAKAVVWAHNSHIGDARFTAMGAERDEVNIGQLCREKWGGEAVLVGFGTHEGTVAAASEWDAPMEIKAVRPSRPDSQEALCHAAGLERCLLDLRPDVRSEGRSGDRSGGPPNGDGALRDVFSTPRLERYIGVVYRPETERWSHYSPAILADQYDAFVWFDRTRAVTPLPARAEGHEEETYPFGL